MHDNSTIYTFQTSLGLLAIRPHRTRRDMVELWLNDECYGAYGNANLAAGDVDSRHTGMPLDRRRDVAVPRELVDWTAVRRR